jgi:hypothetical protein
MFIGTLYFLGRYRPLYVEGDTAEEVFVQLERRALQAPPEALERLQTLRMSYSPRYTSQSAEFGTYGAAVRETDAHPLPPALWDAMPPCPGLIYN